MRRNQYSSEKRRKELDRKKKQEEKRQRKLERKNQTPEDGTAPGPDGEGTGAPVVDGAVVDTADTQQTPPGEVAPQQEPRTPG